MCRPNHRDNPVPAGFSGHHPSNASFPIYWVSEPGTISANKYWSLISQHWLFQGHSLTWSLQPPYLPSHCIISNIQGWRSSAHGVTLLFFISLHVEWFLCVVLTWFPYLGEVWLCLWIHLTTPATAAHVWGCSLTAPCTPWQAWEGNGLIKKKKKITLSVACVSCSFSILSCSRAL